MSEQAVSADPVDYPVVRIGGKEETIRIGVNALIQLNKKKINIFEPPPYSPEWNAWAALINQIKSGKEAGTLDEAGQNRLQAEANDAWLKIPAERREWRNPLSRGTLGDQLAITTEIVAAVLSSETRAVTAAQIADAIEMDEVKPLFDALIIAIKKVSAQLGL